MIIIGFIQFRSGINKFYTSLYTQKLLKSESSVTFCKCIFIDFMCVQREFHFNKMHYKMMMVWLMDLLHYNKQETSTHTTQ